MERRSSAKPALAAPSLMVSAVKVFPDPEIVSLPSELNLHLPVYLDPRAL